MYVRAHHVANNNCTASLVSVNLLFKPPAAPTALCRQMRSISQFAVGNQLG